MDQMMEKIAEKLTLEMIPEGIWKVVAEEVGTVNLIKVLSIINGDKVYVPKPDRFLAPARDTVIKQEFNGFNHEELARKYDLSTGYIRSLCGSGYLKNQIGMFD